MAGANAHGFRLQMSPLREEAWHDDGSRRWGSAYYFTQKLARFIGCIESRLPRTGASCCAPAGPLTSQPTDQSRHSRELELELIHTQMVQRRVLRAEVYARALPFSCASRNSARISFLVAARKAIPFSELPLLLYPGSGHCLRFDSDLLLVHNCTNP
jgi:hypothetical protein